MIRIIQGLLEVAKESLPHTYEYDSRVRDARVWLEKYEWSGERQGQGFGPHGSGDGGLLYPACPECLGLKQPNNEFAHSAIGHRSGCRIADVLKRPTYVEPGETGELAL